MHRHALLITVQCIAFSKPSLDKTCMPAETSTLQVGITRCAPPHDHMLDLSQQHFTSAVTIVHPMADVPQECTMHVHASRFVP